MKTIKVLSIVGLLAFNLVLLSKPASAVENEGLVKGLKGSVNGVPTCHCPDDAKTCYCNIH